MIDRLLYISYIYILVYKYKIAKIYTGHNLGEFSKNGMFSDFWNSWNQGFTGVTWSSLVDLKNHELHGCQNGAVIFYGLWLSHQTFQLPKMEDVYNRKSTPKNSPYQSFNTCIFWVPETFWWQLYMYTSLLKKKTHHDGTSQVGRFDDYVRISLDQPLGDVKISYITKKQRMA